MRRKAAIAAVCCCAFLSLLGRAGRADDEGPVRREDATVEQVFAGPFHSSRLFAMPTADIVGAYQLSLNADGSLLQETGVLSSAGALAIGVGDLAQFEYRHTGVIGIEGGTAPIPTFGVQLKLPIPDRPLVPALGIALRLGRSRPEQFGDLEVDERVTDLYVVTRVRLPGRLRGVALHGGLRRASASMEVEGMGMPTERSLYLPTVGFEVTMNRRAQLIGEAGQVPIFDVGDDPAAPAPEIRKGVLGRFGARWFAHPAFAIDASLGYQIEAARVRGGPARGPSSVVQWDIRLGGELFVPWGALVCRAAGVFCE